MLCTLLYELQRLKSCSCFCITSMVFVLFCIHLFINGFDFQLVIDHCHMNFNFLTVQLLLYTYMLVLRHLIVFCCLKQKKYSTQVLCCTLNELSWFFVNCLYFIKLELRFFLYLKIVDSFWQSRTTIVHALFLFIFYYYHLIIFC